jgi:hypothetical protein
VSVDQVRVHIVSRSPECSTDLAAVLADEVRRRHPGAELVLAVEDEDAGPADGMLARREIAVPGLRGNPPALIQIAPPLAGGAAEPSPKLPRG